MPHDPVDIAVQLHDRACAYRERGEYRRAAVSCRRSLRLLEKAEGEAHPDVANVLNTIGRIQEDLATYSSAEDAYRRSVSIMDSLADEGDTDMRRVRVQSRVCLAGILRMQGKYAEAEPLFLEALDFAEEFFGPNDAEVASVLNALGVLYKYTGNFDEAEKLYRRALTILSVLSPDDPGVASIYHNLGGLEHSRGRFAEGEPYARRSVEIREKALGPDHPDVAADIAALASLLQGQDKFDEADQLYSRVLAIFERIYGPEHYEMAVNFNNLAALRCAQGRPEEARPLYRRALAIKEKILGRDHPDVAMTLHNLAALCKTTGDLDQAAKLYQRALAIFAAALGEEHQKTKICRDNYRALRPNRTSRPVGPPGR